MNIRRPLAEKDRKLFNAIRENDMAAAEQAVTDGASFEAHNERGQTPLRYAITKGHRDIALFLFELGAHKEDGRVLPTAISFRQWEIARDMIESNFGGDFDVNGLYGASSTKDAPLAYLLAQRIGDNPEAMAFMRFLLERGAEVNLQNSAGQTPLCMATLNNDLEPLAILLAAGADPSLGEEKGDMPLCVAAMKPSPSAKIIEALLKAGAEADEDITRNASPKALEIIDGYVIEKDVKTISAGAPRPFRAPKLVQFGRPKI